MRLIDADELMNRLRGNVLIDVTAELENEVAQQPTAFDKEKVIRNLQEELKLAEIEKERCITENPSQFGSAKGYANGVDFAIEIVEKGGIE